jgi:hypothetical protein
MTKVEIGELLMRAMGKIGSDEVQVCGTSRKPANQAQPTEDPGGDQCLDYALYRTELHFKK